MRYVKRKLTYRSEIQVEERDELYKKKCTILGLGETEFQKNSWQKSKAQLEGKYKSGRNC